jgi:putative RNA 2'-phosphotransferase
MAVNEVRARKLLNLVLRHHPEIIGITLDENGWADVDALLLALSINDLPMTFDDLVKIVETNKKRRFAFNAERTRIRSSQGDNEAIDLD